MPTDFIHSCRGVAHAPLLLRQPASAAASHPSSVTSDASGRSHTSSSLMSARIRGAREGANHARALGDIQLDGGGVGRWFPRSRVPGGTGAGPYVGALYAPEQARPTVTLPGFEDGAAQYDRRLQHVAREAEGVVWEDPDCPLESPEEALPARSIRIEVGPTRRRHTSDPTLLSDSNGPDPLRPMQPASKRTAQRLPSYTPTASGSHR